MKTQIFQVIFFLFVVFCGCTKQTEIKSIEVNGVQNPVISLNGTWKFTMTPPEKYWENSVEFQNWADIQVPGECQMQGFAIKHDQPYVYKHKFEVPADFGGKQIQLDFYGVYSYARVWVNGEFVREHFGGFTKWSCDISHLVVAGKTAILTVEVVDRADDISYGSGYAKHQIGGILKEVEITALPTQNFKQLYFETDLDENYQNADLKVFYELSKNTPSKIKVELIDAENQLVKAIEKDAESHIGEVLIQVKNPLKWDAEHPSLYTVVTTLFEDGKETLKASEKIGFREVVVDGNKMLVNGKPVKLRGACRHDIHPTLGRLTTPEYDLLDVQLARECNMNFIRTSHYPPSETFLEYCDEYGIYVEDETAICFVGSHRTDAYRATGASQSDPEFTERYLSQLKEMVDNHRNHPSVIIWSIGNENLFGENFKLSYEWVKENDKTRPVIFSYPQNVPDGIEAYEIFSNHYPNWDGNSIRYKNARIKGFEFGNIPALFDEWAHVACYNNFEIKEDPNVRNFWGQSLDSMWTYLFESEGGLGGAIWCMLDETFMLPEDLDGYNEWWGILDKNIIPATYMGPTVGYGEWGIIDSWRRKKPEFWGTKKAYSPTKIYTKQINEFQPNSELKIQVHNRFDHTNFSELMITWKYGEKSGKLENINLEPHKRGELVFPANNWNSDEKLNICFYQDDNYLVDEYNIQLGKKEIELPICKSGNLNIDETDDQITISGKNMKLNVNKRTGLLENVKVNGETVIKSGPYTNLKIPGKRVQYSTIEMQDYAENWHCVHFNYKVEDGIAVINSAGVYDSVAAHFVIKIDENGVFNIDYQIENVPESKTIQEAGLKFITGDLFETLVWDRNSYYTAYPEGDLGSLTGEVDMNEKPEMNYREKPNHSWEMDSKGFYYFGLKEELPYTNIVRGLKENIYSYSLKTNNAELEVLSEGKQACRFDKIDEKNTLVINEMWDYNSLLWGNYAKQIKSEGSFTGKVFIQLN